MIATAINDFQINTYVIFNTENGETKNILMYNHKVDAMAYRESQPMRKRFISILPSNFFHQQDDRRPIRMSLVYKDIGTSPDTIDLMHK